MICKIHLIPLAMISFLFLVPPASGQQNFTGRDKYSLLTMPFNKRQLTLYRGQLQSDAGYKFAVRTHTFNEEGKIERITSKSTGSVYHYYFMNLRYGVLDFLELSAETSMLRRGMREETVTYISASLSSSDRVSVNKLTETRGLGDILVMATLRLPVRYRWFDLSASGGLYLPSSEYKPAKPTNTVTDVLTSNSYTINYHYNNKYGYGVPVYLLTGSAKGGINKLTGEFRFSFKTPREEGTSIRWEENMVNKVFAYNDREYKYLLSNSYTLYSVLHYQATGWFDLYAGWNYNLTRGGWTEYYGKKYMNKESSIMTIEPGFELHLSPTLTICQTAGFPVTGKNSDAPFFLFTTVRYSFFPLFR